MKLSRPLRAHPKQIIHRLLASGNNEDVRMVELLFCFAESQVNGRLRTKSIEVGEVGK